MKIIVCGSRSFEDVELLNNTMDWYTKNLDMVEVVSGGQKRKVDLGGGRYKITGADYYGEEWALAHWIEVKIFHADWDRHGKAAGPIRNREMLKYVGAAGSLVAFWDGRSPGTADMIEIARKVIPAKRIKVVRY